MPFFLWKSHGWHKTKTITFLYKLPIWADQINDYMKKKCFFFGSIILNLFPLYCPYLANGFIIQSHQFRVWPRLWLFSSSLVISSAQTSDPLPLLTHSQNDSTLPIGSLTQNHSVMPFKESQWAVFSPFDQYYGLYNVEIHRN